MWRKLKFPNMYISQNWKLRRFGSCILRKSKRVWQWNTRSRNRWSESEERAPFTLTSNSQLSLIGCLLAPMWGGKENGRKADGRRVLRGEWWRLRGNLITSIACSWVSVDRVGVEGWEEFDSVVLPGFRASERSNPLSHLPPPFFFKLALSFQI